MSSSALSSTTASRPSRVTVSTSIMARSAAENAGTCEYAHEESSPPSITLTSAPTSVPDAFATTHAAAPHKDAAQLVTPLPVQETYSGCAHPKLAPRCRPRTQFPACCETIPPPPPTAPVQTPTRASEMQSPPPTKPQPHSSATALAFVRSIPQNVPAPLLRLWRAPAASPHFPGRHSRSPPEHPAARPVQTSSTSPRSG